MNIVAVISSLSPAAQVALVLGCFTLIFLLAYNRKAGLNLIAFLRDFCSLVRHKDSYESQNSKNKEQKKYHKRNQRLAVLPRKGKKGQSMERGTYGE